MAELFFCLVFCTTIFGLFSGLGEAAVNCGGNIYLPAEGWPIEITTPNFPNKYPNNTFCQWTILAPARKVVQVDALFFGLSSTKTSFVVLGDKGVGNPTAINSAPGPLGWRSRTSTAEIGFASQSQSDGRGFRFSLRPVEANTDCVERIAPKFNVSLDEPASTRWHHVVTQFPYLNITTYGMLNVFNFFAEGSFYPFSGNFSPARKQIVLDYLARLPVELKEELYGIAKSSKVDIEFITMANIVYEIVTFCTSIVASDANGKPIHGRNLDFRGTPLLRDDTIHVDFIRNGQIVYSVITIAGSISLMTAQKPGVFTYSLNRRITGNNGSLNLDVFRNTSSTVLLRMVREALETATTYEQAVELFSKALLPSPCYLIVGGTRENEGVILTRNQDGPVDIYPIDVPKGRWYVAQTNTDRWLPFDNKTDPFSPQNRLDLAEKALDRIGRQNINVQTMFDVIATPAVYNHATVFSTVMSASNPSAMETRVRCPLPVSAPAVTAGKKPKRIGLNGELLPNATYQVIAGKLLVFFAMISASF